MSASVLYQDFVTSAAAQDRRAPDDDIEVRLARVRGKARAAGFAEGAASAEATFDRDLRARIEALTEALHAQSEAHAATDQAALSAIRRILEDALTVFLPHLADEALPGQVAEAVTAALRSETNGAVVVEIAPDRADDVRAALAADGDRVTVSPSATLSSARARILWRGGFDEIDTRAAIEAGRALLIERLRGNAPASTEEDILS